MSGLFEECREYFGTDDLYAVLGLSKSAADKEGELKTRVLHLPILRWKCVVLFLFWCFIVDNDTLL